jgi:hypothetical protein
MIGGRFVVRAKTTRKHSTGARGTAGPGGQGRTRTPCVAYCTCITSASRRKRAAGERERGEKLRAPPLLAAHDDGCHGDG